MTSPTDLSETRDLTPARAQQLENEIVRGVKAGRAAFFHAAAHLTEYIEGEGWRYNHESLDEFLASAELEMNSTDAYRLKRVYRGWVLEHGVPHGELADVDPKKLDAALPALEDKGWRDVLSDCRTLSRADVQAKYREGRSPDAPLDATAEPAWCSCPRCGKTHRAAR